jgi:hypothetical protein
MPVHQRKRLRPSRLISPFYLAVLYTGVGEKNQALAWLAKAYEEHSYLLTYLNLPIFDSLRADPRFIALLRQVGLQP